MDSVAVRRPNRRRDPAPPRRAVTPSIRRRGARSRRTRTISGSCGTDRAYPRSQRSMSVGLVDVDSAFDAPGSSAVQVGSSTTTVATAARRSRRLRRPASRRAPAASAAGAVRSTARERPLPASVGERDGDDARLSGGTEHLPEHRGLKIRHVPAREDDPLRVRDVQPCGEPAERSLTLDRIPRERHPRTGRHRRLLRVGREHDDRLDRRPRAGGRPDGGGGGAPRTPPRACRARTGWIARRRGRCPRPRYRPRPSRFPRLCT